MDDFTKGCVAAIVIVGMLVGFPAGCVVHQNQRIAEGIKSGADPILVACAYRSEGKEPMCMKATREAQ